MAQASQSSGAFDGGSPSGPLARLHLCTDDAPLTAAAARGGPAADAPSPQALASHIAPPEPAAAEGVVLPLGYRDRHLFRTACQHRGSSAYGSRTSDHRHGLDERDYAELFACVTDCWERVHPGPWMRPGHSHACTQECPFIVHRDTYVCAWSGSLHYCTESACALATEVPGGRVCPLSNKLYAAHWQHTFDEVGHLDRQRRSDTRVIATLGAKPRRDHLAVHSSPSPSPTSSACSSSSSPSAAAAAAIPRRPATAKARAAAAAPIQDTVFAIEGYITRFIEPDQPLSQPQRHQIALDLLDAWRLIKKTGHPMPSSYTIQAHVLTMLHAFAENDLSVGDVVFARFHPELVGRMRPLKDCVVAELGAVFKVHTAWMGHIGTVMKLHHTQVKAAIAEEAEARAREMAVAAQRALPIVPAIHWSK